MCVSVCVVEARVVTEVLLGTEESGKEGWEGGGTVMK